MTSTVLVPRRVDELRGTAVVVGVDRPARRVVGGPDRRDRASCSRGSRWRSRVFITIGEIVRITLPGDREAAPLGAAGALAYALLASFGGVATTQDVWQVISLVALASFLGALPHVTAGRSPRIDEIARRILAAAFAAAHLPTDLRRLARTRWPTSRAHAGHGDGHGHGGRRPGHRRLRRRGVRAGPRRPQPRALPLDPARRAARPARPRLGDRRHRRPDRAGRPGHGLVGASPSSASRCCSPSSRSAATPRSARPTCRPSARCRASPRSAATPSPATPVGSARSRVAVGRELGMSEDELLDLEYAALMHDLGQLSLDRADPRRRHRAWSTPDEQRRIAELGAGGHPRDRRARPRRRDHRAPGRPLPPPRASTPTRRCRVSSRIIKAANAYDDMVGDSRRVRPAARRARAAAPGHGLRLRPARRRDPRPDRGAQDPRRRLNPPPGPTPALGSPASSTRSRDRPCPSPERSPRGRRGPRRDGGQHREGDRRPRATRSAVGDTLVILESMKMEIPVFVEHAGTVTQVGVSEGDVVQEGDVIAVIG